MTANAGYIAPTLLQTPFPFQSSVHLFLFAALLDKLQGHTKAIQASGFESLELTRVKGAL